MLSDAMVEKFRELYRTSFGEDITKEEAYDQGLKLLQLVKAIYRPFPNPDK